MEKMNALKKKITVLIPDSSIACVLETIPGFSAIVAGVLPAKSERSRVLGVEHRWRCTLV